MRASPIPSSRQDAEAGSWIGLPAAKPYVQAVDPEVGKSFFLEWVQRWT